MLLMNAIPITAASGDLAAAVILVGVGVILWAAGGWVLRPAVGALGLGLGVLGGFLIWIETGIGPAWAAPLIGGIIAACVALLAYKLLAGVMLALSLALLASTTTWTVLSLTEPDVPPVPVGMLFGLPEAVPPAGAAEPSNALPAQVPGLTMPLQLANHAHLTPIRSAWTAMPADPRLAILLMAGGGLLGGLVLSTLFTRTGAILLTAVAGAGLIIAGLPRLLAQWDVAPEWLATDPAGGTLTLAWLGASVIGLVVQGMTKPTPPANQSRS
ncbi:MAG: hypothetical protein QF733_02835 [Phycisphaerales bacterium]|jgi:hypothetical protein|nr:hypothetical protein [Phycisphaerales bacterium]